MTAGAGGVKHSLSLLSIEFKIYSDAAAAAAKSLQSCPTLCDPTDGSPPGSAVPGILQARTLECVSSAERGGNVRTRLGPVLLFSRLLHFTRQTAVT